MPDFRRVWLIIRREWWTRLRQRSFQITTIIQVLFVIAAGCIPAAVARFVDEAPSTWQVLVVDTAGIDAVTRLQPYVSPANGIDAADDEITLEASTLSAGEARQVVDMGGADAALVVSRGDNGDLAFDYYNQSGETDALAQRIFAGASAITVEDRLERSGIDEAEFAAAMAPPAFTVGGAEPAAAEDDDTPGGAQIALAYFFTILMFMAIMLYGTWVAQGVVEEKSSRIMEIMVNAATPRDLLAGKVIGIGAAGLTQLLPMLLAGGLVFALQEPIARAIGADTESLPEVDFGALSFTSIGWFLVYFLLGFTLYAALYASLGSLVSRQEEVNQAVSPMMTVMMLGYFSAFFTMWAPDALFSRVLSIFPLTAPFVMISRVIVGDPPAWELALSVALVAVSMVLAVLFAARVYRIGVLWYGQKPSWKALFSRQLEQAAR